MHALQRQYFAGTREAVKSEGTLTKSLNLEAWSKFLKLTKKNANGLLIHLLLEMDTYNYL